MGKARENFIGNLMSKHVNRLDCVNKGKLIDKNRKTSGKMP